MMEAIAQFHFIRPTWLWLVPLGIIAWWMWQRNTDTLRGWRAQIDPELLEALVVGNVRRRDWQHYWLLAGWMLTAVAIAGPTWRLEPNPFAADAQPLVILLKADETMLLPPPSPSRLERAQLKIADLAEARKGQPLGLIAYAGSAHLVLPPTRDTDIVAKMASEVSPEIMPETGDRLVMAIKKASNLLTEGQKGGSLLVIADSASIDANGVDSIHNLKYSFPIQFLSLVDEGSPERESIDKAAHSLHASVQTLTLDNADISSVIAFAKRRAATGVAGESSRWQEAGYWVTPVIAFLVAFSFRRRNVIATEGPR